MTCEAVGVGSASGWRTSTASSAEEFLSRPRVMAPGCLLMELRLPGLSGLHLQRVVLDRTEMPVIFMSGAADIPTTVTAMRAGAIEFLTKPLRSDVVMQAIGEALEQSQAALRDMARTLPLRERYESLSCRAKVVEVEDIEVIATSARKIPTQCAGPQREMRARPQIQQRPQYQGAL